MLSAMQKTLAWDIISSLDAIERREAGYFLASPYYNRRDDLRQLFQIMAEAAKNRQEPPGREAVYQQMFPHKKYDDQHLRLLLSGLLKILEQFLVQKELRNDPLGQPHLLLSAYRKRKLPAHFQTTLKRLESSLKAQALRHPEFYFEKFALEQERYRFLSEAGRTQELNLQSVEDGLSAAMLGMKLRQACLLRSHEAVFNTRYNVALMEEILAAAQLPVFQGQPAVQLYFHCYLALFKNTKGVSQEKRDADYQAFKQMLFENVQHFPKAEMRDLYLLAINFCIKKINENASQYYREAHDLYRSGLETELLLEDGKLSRFTYNNIVGLSIRIPEVWQWVEWFVENYRNHLDTAHRDAYFNLSSARLEFARKNYKAALLHLQRADYRDLINNLVAKTIQLKIYFETQEFDLLDSHLRTMRMYIQRNKKLGYHRENWSNIVRYTRKLMELNPFDETARAALRSEIANEEILTEKEWLLGRLE